MINSIEKYLRLLSDELADTDSATRQDALSDAEDHLRAALYAAAMVKPEASEGELLSGIVDEYGTPEETAEAYRGLEGQYVPGLAREFTGRRKQPSGSRGFFHIYRDARAWGALLYALLSLMTGVLYFTWTVTGVSLSVSFLILIVGIPVATAFFFSFHGLAFLEGRIVEALLGERMPRLQRFFKPNMSWGERIKRMLLGKDSWLIIIYLFIMLPLGVIYFSLAVTLISISLSFIAAPFAYLVYLLGNFNMEVDLWLIPEWSLPLFAVLGVFLLTATLHIFRGIGKFQGKLAKALLVSGDYTR